MEILIDEQNDIPRINEAKAKMFEIEFKELCAKYGVELIPTIQIQVR